MSHIIVIDVPKFFGLYFERYYYTGMIQYEEGKFNMSEFLSCAKKYEDKKSLEKAVKFLKQNGNVYYKHCGFFTGNISRKSVKATDCNIAMGTCC